VPNQFIPDQRSINRPLKNIRGRLVSQMSAHNAHHCGAALIPPCLRRVADPTGWTIVPSQVRMTVGDRPTQSPALNHSTLLERESIWADSKHVVK